MLPPKLLSMLFHFFAIHKSYLSTSHHFSSYLNGALGWNPNKRIQITELTLPTHVTLGL